MCDKIRGVARKKRVKKIQPLKFSIWWASNLYMIFLVPKNWGLTAGKSPDHWIKFYDEMSGKVEK